MADQYTRLLKIKAEEKIVGRELFAIYLGAILGELVESFPQETRIDLNEYVGMTPFNMSAMSNSPEDSQEKEALTAQWVENHEQKLAIARGTLLFAIRAGLIHSPNIEEFMKAKHIALASCTLSERGYAAIFQAPGSSIEDLLKPIVSALAPAGNETSVSPEVAPESASDSAQHAASPPHQWERGSADIPGMLVAFSGWAKRLATGAVEQTPHIMGATMGAYLAHVVPLAIGHAAAPVVTQAARMLI